MASSHQCGGGKVFLSLGYSSSYLQFSQLSQLNVMLLVTLLLSFFYNVFGKGVRVLPIQMHTH